MICVFTSFNLCTFFCLTCTPFVYLLIISTWWSCLQTEWSLGEFILVVPSPLLRLCYFSKSLWYCYIFILWCLKYDVLFTSAKFIKFSQKCPHYYRNYRTQIVKMIMLLFKRKMSIKKKSRRKDGGVEVHTSPSGSFNSTVNWLPLLTSLFTAVCVNNCLCCFLCVWKKSVKRGRLNGRENARGKSWILWVVIKTESAKSHRLLSSIQITNWAYYWFCTKETVDHKRHKHSYIWTSKPQTNAYRNTKC